LSGERSQLGNKPSGGVRTSRGFMAHQLLMLGFAIATFPAMVSAQQLALPTPAKSVGNPDVTLQWGGVTWRMPERFFRPISDKSDELLIQLGWIKQSNTFIPVSVRGYDLSWDIHVRKVNSEDPRNGLATLQRSHATLSKFPQLASIQLTGMTYLGSTSGMHFFVMADHDAYVECRSIPATLEMPPDIMNEPLVCETTFHLPHQLYAWVRTWRIKLADVQPGFVAAYDALYSFMN
jgi:hypothetical protein